MTEQISRRAVLVGAAATSQGGSDAARIYDMLVADRMMVQGFHYPFPGLAYVEKAGNGYREVPLPWGLTI